ncbi:uncharacterized protein E0L32_005015 [Thyridium curvatum]|uniref:BTB domain-containing protein n=1 Tax=Thyridium curvatum TaxID=1093900 RepID=A0A507B6Z6_9PEZI|nr:uncharacterized protein E0L32_005015 [Thyridium curvatum]TPX14906.1 hypothetical protein E0L32_005015 [Thyridium curvatum]
MDHFTRYYSSQVATREERLKDLEEKMAKAAPPAGEFRGSIAHDGPSTRVTLRVSHHIFVTTEATLTAESRYFRCRLWGLHYEGCQCSDGAHPDGRPDDDGTYFVNADPYMFEHIYEHMRLGRFPLLYDVETANFEFGKYAALLHWAKVFDVYTLERWIEEERYRGVVRTVYEPVYFYSYEDLMDHLKWHDENGDEDQLELSYMWVEGGRVSSIYRRPGWRLQERSAEETGEERSEESGAEETGEGRSEELRLQTPEPRCPDDHRWCPFHRELLGVFIRKTVVFRPWLCYKGSFRGAEEEVQEGEEEVNNGEEGEVNEGDEEAVKKDGEDEEDEVASLSRSMERFQ